MTEDKPGTPSRRNFSDYLANERTFLAWVRTSLSFIGLGFAVAKFDVWLQRLSGSEANASNGWGTPIGLFMITCGAFLAVLAALQYHMTNLRIERGDARPNRLLVIAVLALVVGLSAIIFLYVLQRRAPH
jgi:putative membrane protein